jgi:hypothetical protein
VSYYSVDPDRLEDEIANYAKNVVPTVRTHLTQAGLMDAGVMLLVDRQSGKSLSISFWRSEDEMHATEELGNRYREATAVAGGGLVVGVERYEVAVDDGLLSGAGPEAST